MAYSTSLSRVAFDPRPTVNLLLHDGHTSRKNLGKLYLTAAALLSGGGSSVIVAEFRSAGGWGLTAGG
jgi:hypothetical protein